MDNLIKKRKPVRALVTRICNEVDQELSQPQPDMVTLQTHLHRLNTKKLELAALDEEMCNQMLEEGADEEELQREVDKAEEYQTKLIKAEVKLNNVFTPMPVPSARDDSANWDYASVASNSKTDGIKLPKIKLKEFDGKLKSWIGWWGQFQRIHTKDGTPNEDKFQYLLQAMQKGTEAWELVNSYPPSGDNYHKAVEALKRKYGREDVLLQVYLREMLGVAMGNATGKEKLGAGKLRLKFSGLLQALESLNLSKTDPSTYFFPLMESGLSEDLMKAWQRNLLSKVDGSKLTPPKSSVDLLMDFLGEEEMSEQRIELAQSGFQDKPEKEVKRSGGDHSQKKKRRWGDKPVTQAELFGGSSTKRDPCIFCGKDGHPSSNCYKAAKMPYEEKNKLIGSSGRCYRCVDKTCRSKECQEKVRCPLCQRPNHISIMCRDHPSNKKSVEQRNEEYLGQIPQKFKDMVVRDQAENSSHANNASVQCTGDIALNTILVRVTGPNPKKDTVIRLMIDEGAQHSHVTTGVVNEVQSRPVGREITRSILFHAETTEFREVRKHELTLSALDGRNKVKWTFRESEALTGKMARWKMGPWMKELREKGIFISDVENMPVDSEEINVIIGIDYRSQLTTGRVLKLKCGLEATETIFGWALGGPLPGVNNCAQQTIHALMSVSEVKQMWDLDVLGIKEPAEQKTREEHEEAVKQDFQKSLKRNEEGRYIVGLPWVMDNPKLPTNRGVALKRLERATSTKLAKTEDYKKYGEVFRAWEEESLITRVGSKVDEGHYLPHRPVFKPESTTTPIRPVFDASCKVKGHPSLNQCLEKGPNMLELIPSIILKFREKEVGGISDIRKAFQMIEVQPEDRKFQKFLWWNPQGEVMEYEHCRVVFGMNCSPFILAAVIDHHLKNVPEDEKEIAEQLNKCLYVDNCVASFNTVEEYEEFKEKSTSILARAKMELREWERTGEPDMEKTVTGVLGMKWDKKEDVLYCQTPEFIEVPEVVTKRVVLSSVAKVFDPIGITAPALIIPKLLIQESWALGLGWDDPWPEEKRRVFLAWLRDIGALGAMKIPRCALGRKWELHVFVDASQDSYAAVVFGRSEEGGGVGVQLLLAKSRLAPLGKKKGKRVTIPRLELLACLIGVRLGKAAREAFEKAVVMYFWSDSTTALAWIRRNGDWGTFVGNRVREIRDCTEPDQWRHVPGVMNPADLPSRGCSPSELLGSKWWEGPDWLKCDRETWPSPPEDPDEEEVEKEVKKTVVTTLCGNEESTQPRFGRYTSNVRVAGWVRRFINYTRSSDKKRVGKRVINTNCDNVKLTEEEIKMGERDLIYQLQKIHFQVKPKIKGKEILVRDDGVLVVNTRLTNLEDEEDFKSPMILPRKEKLVSQLIHHVHESCGHGGTQVVLGMLREKYWVVQGRRAVDTVIHNCVVCRRFAAKSLRAEPAPLPQKRVQAQYAFQTTGVDLAGPLYLKGGEKVWVVLYTCAVFRGVHLDLVDSLSAEVFMRSMERFVNTIGRPNTLYSDNGTNFVASKRIMELFGKELKELRCEKIRWNLNPPASPWWGGFYERLVQPTKGLLKRMLGRTRSSQDEMRTILSSVANTMNQRPLTTVTEDGGDLIPLTPAMFMRGLPVGDFPEGELGAKELSAAYRRMQNLKAAVTARFRKEYLGIIQQRARAKATREIELGEVVLVGIDNKKRFEWPMGRIVEIMKGGDGKVRLAGVKTTNGIIKRPPERLYPLEVRTIQEIPISAEMKFTEEVEPVLEESDEEEPEVVEKVVLTKSGRRTKKPSRYGQWFHQIQK